MDSYLSQIYLFKSGCNDLKLELGSLISRSEALNMAPSALPLRETRQLSFSFEARNP